MNFRKYRGYIGARMLFGRSVPHHIQQMVIREYCERHGLKFLLSATEYVMEGSTMMLDAALREDTEGIVFYSLGLLPVSEAKRKKIWASGKDIHFAAENIHGMPENLFKTTLFVSDYHAGDQFPRTIAYLDQARLSGACQ